MARTPLWAAPRRPFWLSAPAALAIGLAAGSAAAQVQVSPTTTAPTGAGPSSVTIATFNADAPADLAVTNLNDGTVTTLLGSAGGTFSPGTLITVGSPAQVRLKSIASGRILASTSDLAIADAKGYLALFASSGGAFTGIGDNADPGSLHNPQSWGIAQGSVVALVEDFSGGGLNWAVAGLQKDTADFTTRLRAGDGDGGLRGGDWPVQTGLSPSAVAVGSFNRTVANAQFAAAWPGITQPDTRKDLAICNAGENSVDIFLHVRDQVTGTIVNGQPTAGPQGVEFWRSQHITFASPPIAVAVGRFNADTLDDLAVICPAANRMYILLGSGDGKFIADAVGTPIPPGAAAVAAGDLDADGRDDLVVLCNGAQFAALTGQGIPPGIPVPLTGTITAIANGGSRGVGFEGTAAFVWQVDLPKVPVPKPGGGTATRAYAMSSDGNWVVGSATDPARGYASHAYRWSSTPAGSAATWCATLAGSTASDVRAVSADGLTIGGWSTTAARDFACRWTLGGTTVASIESLLGATLPAGTQLLRCYGASDDGRVFFGEGRLPNATAMIWVARFPATGSPTLLTFAETSAVGARLSLDGTKLCLVQPSGAEIRIYDAASGSVLNSYIDQFHPFGGRHYIGMSDDGLAVFGWVRDSFNSLAPGTQTPYRIAGFSRLLTSSTSQTYDQTTGSVFTGGTPPSPTPTPFMMRSGVILTDATRRVAAGAAVSVPLSTTPPNQSLAFGLSRDGTRVCGATIPDQTFHAAAWPTGGPVASFGGVESYALGVSNTNVVVGRSPNQLAFRYAAGVLTELPPVQATNTGQATAITPDGVTTVGFCSTTGIDRAFRHTVAEGVVELPRAGASKVAALAISDNGQVIVGYRTGGQGTEPCRWINSAGPTGLGFLPVSPASGEASGANADGSVIVGVSGPRAFRWTASGGMAELPSPAGTTPSSMYARAVSSDGRTVVGWINAAGLDQAWIWVEGAGSFLASDYFLRLGIDTTGWRFDRLRAVSGDGTLVAGYGLNPLGQQEAFVVRIGSLLGSAVAFRNLAGGSNFEPVARLNTGLVPSSLKVANIVGTSRPDVVITAQGSNRVEVYDFRLPCRVADIASLGGSVGADGQLTPDDLIAFLAAFFSGNTAVADLASLGGALGADGILSADDVVAFLAAFFAGC